MMAVEVTLLVIVLLFCAFEVGRAFERHGP